MILAALSAIAVSVLGLVLVWSGVSKLRRPGATARAMDEFGLTRLAGLPGAVALSLGEILLGVILVTGVVLVLALSVATLLFTLFALLILQSLRAGRSFPCNCFGETQSPLSRWTLARAIGLATLAFVLAVINDVAGRSATVHEVAVAVCAAGAVLSLGLLGRSLPIVLQPAVNPRAPVHEEPLL